MSSLIPVQKKVKSLTVNNLDILTSLITESLSFSWKAFAVLALCQLSLAQSKPVKTPKIIAYYAGDDKEIDSYDVEGLTHIIFSFCHLSGNQLQVDDAKDSLAIRRLVSLKAHLPSLKVMLSLGGWGGCESCSEVFSSQTARLEFSKSVLHLNEYFDTDGIDLDWEYPAIAGFPNHTYQTQDKDNFTGLIRSLRNVLGEKYEISFAAGGFEQFLQHSVDWDAIAPLVDWVNLMSYDLINGNSTLTGHHTALYSTPQQRDSADNAIRFFQSKSFPLNKLVIGAAFYGRLFELEKAHKNGLYQKAIFKKGISWKKIDFEAMKKLGYKYYWDNKAQAPYLYNKKKRLFFTYDSKRSIALKSKYVLDKGLGGIMFWQLTEDSPKEGLLSSITKVIGK